MGTTAIPKAPLNQVAPPFALVAHTSGRTAAADFDREFVELTAEQALSRLGDFQGAIVVLNSHMPPWGPVAPKGYLTIEVVTPTAQTCCLGIAFGGLDADSPRRSGFDFGAFSRHPDDPQSCGIWLASFDECWLLVCRLLEELDPSSVHFSFGA